MLKRIVIMLAIVSSVTVSSAVLAEISIGVIAPRGKDKANARWSEWASYLSQKTGEKVKVHALPPAEIMKKADKMNFMLVNPTQTVILQETRKARQLATLHKKSGSQFGGVIVAKKGRGIKRSEDLKGKKVMGLKFRVAAGAYMFQTYHLIQRGINPHEDFASFTEGKRQDELVMAVKSGEIDAAFIRTGVLEAMAREKKIKLSDFVVVDQVKNSKVALTTDLYPEWSLMAMPDTNNAIVKKVQNVVLNMPASSKAAKKAKITGFVKPVNVKPMRQAMMELGVYPFD